ncbi:MAG: chitobiase/beta-hexosaminidase C-terminal domain-containing protein [Bacteroidales bacterium]|nr:chitobiase/beta-hexosaminidase C-terminal domain-containing protein [Bacteroidales bacterium]
MKKFIAFLFLLTLFVSCEKDETMEQTLTPAFSPECGTYTRPIYVTISCNTPGARIYYTLDGTEPTDSSNVYKTPILLNSTTTIKTYAAKEGMEESPVDTGVFVINTLIEWQKMYGGTYNEDLVTMQQTSDGGYIIGGVSYSDSIQDAINHGESDYYILKIDSHGNKEWHRMYGGSNYETLKSVQQTADGGYIIGGYSYSEDIPGVKNNGGNDYYIIKLDTRGEIEWQKMFGGSDSEYFGFINQTSDGGYILGGYSYSYISGITNGSSIGYYIIKTNSSGFRIWQTKSSYELRGDLSPVIHPTNDNGYIIAGSMSYSCFDQWLCESNICWYATVCKDKPRIVKADMSGNMQWQHEYGYADDEIDFIQQTNDGGYVFTVNSSDYEDYFMRINPSGNVVWLKKYEIGCEYNSIQQTNDGGYIIGGSLCSSSMYGLRDFCVFKINADGYTEWQQIFGGGETDECIIALQTSDGGYMLGGDSQSEDIPAVTSIGASDIYIVKLKGDLSQFVY